MTAQGFNIDLRKFAQKTGLELDTVVRKVALDAYSRVTKKTPVDTGRARANWNVGVGSPDLSVEDDGFKKGTGSHRGKSSSPSSPQASEVTLSRGDGNKTIYITNSLPYIHTLEDGHSTQAPNGMVSLTLSELAAGIRNVIRS